MQSRNTAGSNSFPGMRLLRGNFVSHRTGTGSPGSTLAQAFLPAATARGQLDHLGVWEDFLRDETLPSLVQAALI